MNKTGISWADSTHPFWYGCTEKSEGCRFCYAKRIAGKYWDYEFHKLRRAPEPKFSEPVFERKGRVIFPCSLSDFWHEGADEWRDDAWGVMRKTPQHRWLLLTKRIERVADHLPEDWGDGWPHVWIGTSVENQRRADERLPLLNNVPSLHRFVSAEPLLDMVDLRAYLHNIAWVIVGGESGETPRRMVPMWADFVRKQCEETETIFHFKQMGGSIKIDGEWGGNRLHGQQYLAIPDFWPDQTPPAEQLSMF